MEVVWKPYPGDYGSIGEQHERQDTRRTPGYHRLRDVVGDQNPTLDFSSKDFRLIRVLLRLLSLWRPPTAGVFERYIYPVLVSMLLLLLGPVRNGLKATQYSSWINIRVMYVVHEIVIWLGHILGNYYFRSADLANALPRHRLPGATESLKRKLKFLNGFVILSLVIFTSINCTLFIVFVFNKHSGAMRFSSGIPNIHGIFDHVMFFVVVVTIAYDLGIGLALSWTMGLLYVSYASRLKALEGIFLKWRETTNDAIYYFHFVYARPVKNSWERISWWFLAHNLVALAIPLYGYQLARAVCGIEFQSEFLPQFICYLIFVLTIWLAPIIMGERIKGREKEFQEHVNNFSLGLLNETVESNQPSLMTANDAHFTAVTHPVGSSDLGIPGETTDTYTFATRGKELKYFLHFLKNRNQGLVARGYAFQLSVSLVSLFVGIVSFLITFNGEVEASLKNRLGNRMNNTLY